uniref:DUF7700 domain-containing protein n=1 Tax=viral metagenome TaxID=1070528 RepID=A0A6C0IJD8_9ZZZZ
MRQDIYKVHIQDNLYFLVFHKKLIKGFGSAVSLYINNYEFLKFDCFGENKGHYHFYDNNTNDEIFFNEKTCEEQINRTCDLMKDINVFINKSNRIDIKNFKIDMNNFVNKIDDIRNKMLEYEHKFYSLLR